MDYLGFFTPSVNALPAAARDKIGPASALVERVAMRRVWDVGDASYQVVAVAVPVSAGSVADILLRRRYTLEVGVVVLSGSLANAQGRALACVQAFRSNEVAQRALFSEYEVRATRAGLPMARELKQAFVVAPKAVYESAAQSEIERIRLLQATVADGTMGYRFFTVTEERDEIRVLAAPEPFGTELSLIRSVEGSMKTV